MSKHDEMSNLDKLIYQKINSDKPILAKPTREVLENMSEYPYFKTWHGQYLSENHVPSNRRAGIVLKRSKC
jgi:hypothetical protein